MKAFFNKLFSFLSPAPVWEYGMCKGHYARRHRVKKNVQFVLHEAGRAGHKEDYWYDMHEFWWHEFKPNTAPVSSGLRCDFDPSNPDKVTPI